MGHPPDCNSSTMTSPQKSASAPAIQFHSATFHLNGDGTLYWPDQDTLIVSDLHLEKGAALSQGAPLPQFDTLDTLQRLEKRLIKDNPKRLLCLGDNFHTTERAFRLPADYVAYLHKMMAEREVMWLTGNHDMALPDRLPGTVMSEVILANIRFCHETDHRSHNPTISGHFHPKARVKLRAKQLSARCFLQSGYDFIMPAFGSYTGGLNIRDAAFDAILTNTAIVHLLHDGKIFSMPFVPSVFLSAR